MLTMGRKPARRSVAWRAATGREKPRAIMERDLDRDLMPATQSHVIVPGLVPSYRRALARQPPERRRHDNYETKSSDYNAIVSFSVCARRANDSAGSAASLEYIVPGRRGQDPSAPRHI
jgi:hypothetical protein